MSVLILKYSPEPCLARAQVIRDESQFPGIQFPAQMAALDQSLPEEWGTSLTGPEILKRIYLICFGDKDTIISRISDEQEKLPEKLSVSLEES